MSMSFLEKRKSLERMISSIKLPSRHAIRNAWRCIDRARDLVPIDPEMSYFRAITAEEEAATALINIVKERNYENSKQLNPKSHHHKNITFFVLKLAADHFKRLTKEAKIKTFFTGFEDEKLQIKIDFPWLPDGVLSEPTPPLHLFIKQDGQQYRFQEELNSLILNAEIEKASSFINEQANLRNRLLYASEKGMPSVNDDQSIFINYKEQNVYIMTFVYLLIAQHREKQNLVQQCVDTAIEIAQKVKNKE